MAKKVIDELVSKLGYEYDPKGLVKFRSGTKKTLDATNKLARGITAGVAATFTTFFGLSTKLALGLVAIKGATLAAVTGINTLTNAQERQAEAIGLSGKAFRQWSGLAQAAGFDADIIADLVEEMNNKIGESKNMPKPLGGVTDSLKILKMEFADLILLSPEQQFKKIADAVVNLQDKQAAVSAADILFGGEANKFFGFMRARKKSVDELLQQQQQNIFLSDKSAEAARKWIVDLAKTKGIIKTVSQELAGFFAAQFGGFDELNDKLRSSFRENEPAIRKNVALAAKLMKGFFNFVVEKAPAAGKAISGALEFLAKKENQDSILNFLGGVRDTLEDIIGASLLIGKGVGKVVGKTGNFLFGTRTGEEVPGVPRKEGVVGSALDVSGNLFERGVEGISKILTGTVFDPNYVLPSARVTATGATKAMTAGTTNTSTVNQTNNFQITSSEPEAVAAAVEQKIKQMTDNTTTNSTSGVH